MFSSRTNIRRLIEIGIVTELCRRRDSAAMRDLRDHLLLEEAARREHDHERLIHLLGEFHIKLAMALHNPVLLEHEPAWRQFQDAVLEFTGVVRREGRMDPAREGVLTARERAVLALLCEGQGNAQIGWELGISEKTVRNHVSALYRKLGVRSRAEAIVRVVGRRRAADPS